MHLFLTYDKDPVDGDYLRMSWNRMFGFVPGVNWVDALPNVCNEKFTWEYVFLDMLLIRF